MQVFSPAVTAAVLVGVCVAGVAAGANYVASHHDSTSGLRG